MLEHVGVVAAVVLDRRDSWAPHRQLEMRSRDARRPSDLCSTLQYVWNEMKK
jgi:hypothetical protein|tara:strand:+ start:658 stop:813 length:156 start_codon:yes stop_codon:yes gene_type:complete